MAPPAVSGLLQTVSVYDVLLGSLFIETLFCFVLPLCVLQSGYDERILSAALKEAGFCSLQRVEKFNIFPHDYDSSTVTWLFKTPISLNMVASPCQPGPEDGVSVDKQSADSVVASIKHFSTPFSDRNYLEVPDFEPTTGEFYYFTAAGDRVVVHNYYSR